VLLGDAGGDDGFDLVGFGEAAEALLGVDQVTVKGHLEDAAAALDQGALDSESLFDRLRQTGGAWLVVSNHTILNTENRHCWRLLE